MNQLKKFLKPAWSLWYVRTALIVTAALWFFAFFFLSGAFRGTIEIAKLEVMLQLSPVRHPEVSAAALNRLKWLNSVQENLAWTAFWACVAMVLCYIGYSLDVGYRWLRSRKRTTE